jgi:hypothetical protein
MREIIKSRKWSLKEDWRESIGSFKRLKRPASSKQNWTITTKKTEDKLIEWEKKEGIA